MRCCTALLHRRWYLAQHYITDPHLIGGFKSGLRVWVLVPDIHPLRVYLHCNGLVLFSGSKYVLDERPPGLCPHSLVPLHKCV